MSNPLPGARSGRPRAQAAAAHSAIMDAVYALLHEKSVRDLSMEEVAKRAGVGKPTLYKWWPTKGALVMAMLNERFPVHHSESTAPTTSEQAILSRVLRVISAFNGFFGKVTAELIAEGQSEPLILKELYDRHINQRRMEAIAELERGKASNELRLDTDSALLIDAIFGAIYYRLLLKSGPLTEQYGRELFNQVVRGHRTRPDKVA